MKSNLLTPYAQPLALTLLTKLLMHKGSLYVRGNQGYRYKFSYVSSSLKNSHRRSSSPKYAVNATVIIEGVDAANPFCRKSFMASSDCASFVKLIVSKIPKDEVAKTITKLDQELGIARETYKDICTELLTQLPHLSTDENRKYVLDLI